MPDEDREQLREDLEAALATLRTAGWCQGSFMNDKGQVCALGAVGKSLRIYTKRILSDGSARDGRWHYPIEREHRATTALSEKLKEIHPEWRGNVPLWNDDWRTRQEDVENLFGKVIADL